MGSMCRLLVGVAAGWSIKWVGQGRYLLWWGLVETSRRSPKLLLGFMSLLLIYITTVAWANNGKQKW